MPIRNDAPFGATLYVTTPLPIAEWPLVIVRNAGLLLAATHAHAGAVVTVTVAPTIPATGAPVLVGVTVKLHGGGTFTAQPTSARMPSVIGPGEWIDSALPINGVMRELALPAGYVASFRCE